MCQRGSQATPRPSLRPRQKHCAAAPVPVLLPQLAVLIPAVMGHFTLVGAVAVDAGSALLVVANALR